MIGSATPPRNHPLSLCLLLLLLLMMMVTVVVGGEANVYKRGLTSSPEQTLDGTYNTHTFVDYTDIRCAIACSTANCVGWAADGGTGQCRVYSKILANMVPAPASLKTYLGSVGGLGPVMSPPSGKWTWNDALAACQSLGATLAYVADKPSRDALLTKLGANLYLGLHQLGEDEVNWYDMKGTLVKDPDFAEGQPNDDDLKQDCVAYFASGLEDKDCDEGIKAVGVCTEAN